MYHITISENKLILFQVLISQKWSKKAFELANLHRYFINCKFFYVYRGFPGPPSFESELYNPPPPPTPWHSVSTPLPAVFQLLYLFIYISSGAESAVSSDGCTPPRQCNNGRKSGTTLITTSRQSPPNSISRKRLRKDLKTPDIVGYEKIKFRVGVTM